MGVNPMNSRWDGYLVKALNNLASLTSACKSADSKNCLSEVSAVDNHEEQHTKKKKSKSYGVNRP
jgi:hypothetical protein